MDDEPKIRKVVLALNIESKAVAEEEESKEENSYNNGGK